MDDKGETAARRRRPDVRADDSGGARTARAVPQPPYSTDLLADLHADNMPAEVSEQLWPVVRRDPEAIRFLHSLDDVTAELRALGLDERIIHPIPTEVAARLDRVLAELTEDDEP